MKKGVPISPSDIPAAKAVVIPPEVFDAVNELLAAKCVNGHATLKQYEIAEAIKEKLGECKMEWLNFEQVYQEAGGVSGMTSRRIARRMIRFLNFGIEETFSELKILKKILVERGV